MHIQEKFDVGGLIGGGLNGEAMVVWTVGLGSWRDHLDSSPMESLEQHAH